MKATYDFRTLGTTQDLQGYQEGHMVNLEHLKAKKTYKDLKEIEEEYEIKCM